MIEAIIYARVSDLKQEREGNGLQSQIAVCRDYANRKNVEVAEIFTDTITGGKVSRKGLDSLIRYVKANKKRRFAVVFDDISRMS
jgi:DNA invertase Pin-like site-specific DNA recombinase